MKKVTLIDYGSGNLLSVARAFEHCGAEVELTADSKKILNADYLVLPGVGAFFDGISGLKERNLIESLNEYSRNNRPFLGICLGMQMFLEEAEEFGHHKGLSLIPGSVLPITQEGKQAKKLKIPHIGWNSLHSKKREAWKGTILKNIEETDHVYFVHSFTAFPKNAENRLADSDYEGCLISSVIHNGGSIYGTQFHPEKSGKVGLKILSSFLSL